MDALMSPPTPSFHFIYMFGGLLSQKIWFSEIDLSIVCGYVCVGLCEWFYGKYLALDISKTNKDWSTKFYAKYQLFIEKIFPGFRENRETGSVLGFIGSAHHASEAS